MRIYERLSQIYDLDWGRFGRHYLGLIDELFSERAIKRARILDLACGTGTLAIMLSESGHVVQGIDISPEMIGVAKSKSRALTNISFDAQDMTRFSVKGKFDLVTCIFDSLNYLLDTDSVRTMFYCVANILRETGLFVFDSNTVQLYAKAGKGARERELDGEIFIQEWSYDLIRREATIEFKFSDGNVEIHKQRPYDLTELEPILTDAGLSVVQVFSGFDKEPYDSRSERLMCVAEKPSSLRW